jgi:hypothetical protein
MVLPDDAVGTSALSTAQGQLNSELKFFTVHASGLAMLQVFEHAEQA